MSERRANRVKSSRDELAVLNAQRELHNARNRYVSSILFMGIFLFLTLVMHKRHEAIIVQGFFLFLTVAFFVGTIIDKETFEEKDRKLQSLL